MYWQVKMFNVCKISQYLTSVNHGPPFRCTICGYTAHFSSLLQMHLLTHTRERPYQCGILFRCHASKPSRLHQNSSPFKCHMCDFSANFSSHLQRHLMTHTGQRPFPCHLCPKTFKQKAHLKSHLVSHVARGEM
ncbi:hypothetical protein JTE90_026355 [Oedothorax gibbosus]|uniref:C2H2-type domain-containing protein n=1 Tax=Oedothorax gibbosus TaxID=931172 RepID=A0AAV6UJK8_9ARAC|nr:hypothetical protein JTE90_026355 [Oedothorax gibbosus]